jgi:formiminotetrahydrofolate cyclodeaminase
VSEIRSCTIESFIVEVASASPTLGGESVAAFCAAAAGLALMVCAVGQNKGKNSSLQGLIIRFERLKEAFLDFADQDAETYTAVIEAHRLPTNTNARSEAIDAALRHAAEVPLAVANDCLDLLELPVQLASLDSRSCISDVGVAALLGKAAFDGALLNVEINLAAMKDNEAIAEITARKHDTLTRSVDLAKQALSCVRERMKA